MQTDLDAVIDTMNEPQKHPLINSFGQSISGIQRLKKKAPQKRSINVRATLSEQYKLIGTAQTKCSQL